jgi:hypothetical protein
MTDSAKQGANVWGHVMYLYLALVCLVSTARDQHFNLKKKNFLIFFKSNDKKEFN